MIKALEIKIWIEEAYLHNDTKRKQKRPVLWTVEIFGEHRGKRRRRLGRVGTSG